VSCAAALANIDIIEREGLLERARSMGGRLENGLRAIADDGGFADLRGDTAIFGAAMREDQNAMAVRDAMLSAGVITRAIGAETVTFCPPLVTTDEQIDRICDVFAATLAST
jgi:putrescine aminotransferase